jgi:mycothiol system anti-sigma-R factor
MADCQETLNELESYLDSELSEGRANEIITHLKGCTDCQGAYEFHADLRTAIKTKATKEELPEGFLDRLRDCLGDDVLGNN